MYTEYIYKFKTQFVVYYTIEIYSNKLIEFNTVCNLNDEWLQPCDLGELSLV